jgi:hypothetical protein
VAIHRRKWGLAAFFAAMLAWMITVQVASVLMSRRNCWLYEPTTASAISLTIEK